MENLWKFTIENVKSTLMIYINQSQLASIIAEGSLMRKVSLNFKMIQIRFYHNYKIYFKQRSIATCTTF